MDASPYQEPQRRGPFCQHCGYDLSQTMRGSSCPECGASNRSQEEGSNTAAVAALVLGILGLVTGCVGVILGPIAIWMGNGALAAVREGRAPQSSADLAKAGKVCGIIATVLWGLAVLFYIALFAIGFAGSGSWP